ncbi:MAG: GntR family transcriptional regulator [Gemmatimonadaceae bacterium]
MSTRQQEIAIAMRQRVTSGMHLGMLKAGDRLPSVRDVAREFDADPRVALAAYQALERQHLVELRQRSGIYVAPPAGEAKPFPPTHTEWLIETLVQSIRSGVPAPDFPERVRRCLETLRLRAAVVECNDDQLFSISDELTRDFGIEAERLDMDHLGGNRALPPGARRANCVVTTAPHADLARGIAERLEVPALVVSMCDDLFVETARLLRMRSVYYVVTDPRFAAKLRGVFRGAPGVRNLRVLVNGRDDLAQIPDDAPAYLTRLTRRSVGELPLLERVLPEARVLDVDSARLILRFVVRANMTALGAPAD